MGWTLTEAQKLDLPKLMLGIIPTIIEESALLGGVGAGTARRALTFQTVNSTGIRINRELTLPVSDWYDVDDTITSTKTTYTQVTHTLSTIITQRDLNQFILKGTVGQQNPRTIASMEMAKSVARKVEQRLIYGNNATNSKEPSGIHKLLATDAAASAQVVYASSDATGDPGTLMNLRKAIDLVKPGRPDLLLMSRRTLRNLSSYGSALQSPVQYSTDEFGKRVHSFDDVPIAMSDFCLDTETLTAAGLFSASTGGATSAIFALKVGDRQFSGYELGGITEEDVGLHQSQDARIVRMKWYVSFNFVSTLAGAAYFGLSDAVWTNT